jgi:uncharacterized protein (TIGR02145 family)
MITLIFHSGTKDNTMKRNVLLFISVLLLPLLLGCNPASSNNNNVPDAPSSPTLTSPSNGATSISTTPTLTWGTVSGAATYRVQVSNVSTFSSLLINDSTVTLGNKAINTTLSTFTMYYWRVNAKNVGGTSVWSPTWSFTTGALIVMDADGNVYHSVTIGTQTWTVENLKTTKFNDGTAIPLVTVDSTWVGIAYGSDIAYAGYCWYNNDSVANKNTYGALYNYWAVYSGKLAPAGWHVPTTTEWETLKNFLIVSGYNYDGTTTGNYIAKAMSAKSNWNTNTTEPGAIGNNLSTNNRCGFSALPGGYRDYYDGSFDGIGNVGYWWSATIYANSNVGSLNLYYGLGFLNSFGDNVNCGFSVRLVKN